MTTILSEESKVLLERMGRLLDVNEDWTQIPKSEMVTVKEALSTQDARILIPQVITGMMREAAEPNYVGTNLLQKIRLTDGNSIVFPAIGAMKAHDLGESQSYPMETVDFTLHRSEEIRVGKTGLATAITEEMIEDSQWDVIGILVRKMGEAMARFKEEKAFLQFSKHGNTVFDNDIRQKYSEAGTTGMDINGNLNNTLSTEDLIDMFIANMSNGYNPTDILMHPLAWSMFFKNDILDSLTHSALGGSQITNLKISPDQVQGRIPFSININFTPFIPFDYQAKKFDMYVVDKSNVGLLVEKRPLSTDQFDDPMRDIQTLKANERYGIGVLDQGKAVSVAKNIAFEKSYPAPDRVRVVS